MRRSRDVVFGDVIYHSRGSCGPRVQSDFQIVIMEEGEAVITVNGAEHRLPAGYTALMRPGQREYFEFSRTLTTHHTWCAIHPRRVSGSLAAELRAAPFAQPFNARMQTLVELGLSSANSDSPVLSAVVDKLGDALLQEYLAQATLGSAETALLPSAVRRAKELIETDFVAPLTVARLAKAACCTPNHLTKLFRQRLGITPARYLWQTRVTRGVELLRQTGLSVSEIAYRTGFQTPFHFSRLVKQQHKASPKQLRERTWNTKQAIKQAAL